MEHEFPDLCIICEGEADRLILSHLVKRLLAANSLKRRVEILAAHGKLVIPRMVHAVEARMPSDSLAIVVDSDGSPSKARQTLRKHLDLNKYWVIMAEPNVESWVAAGRKSGTVGWENFDKLAKDADLTQIESTHPEFQTLREAVTSFPVPQ
jgi:predicted ATP-dependent endonuclease of OLD family